MEITEHEFFEALLPFFAKLETDYKNSPGSMMHHNARKVKEALLDMVDTLGAPQTRKVHIGNMFGLKIEEK